MSTQQVHAISVMLESVQQQLGAIKQLVSTLTLSAPAAASPSKRMPDASADITYLSDSEEQQLEDALGVDRQELNAMMGRIAQAAMGQPGEQPNDVSGGS